MGKREREDAMSKEDKRTLATKTGAPSEEAYLLRVQNQQLARDIKGMLRNQQQANPVSKLELRFKSDREGALIFGDKVPPPPGEFRDGLTPVMRDARTRHFRKLPDMDPRLVEKVESELVDIVNHGAPKGATFEDVEEEWVEGKDGQEGHWKVVSRNQY